MAPSLSDPFTDRRSNPDPDACPDCHTHAFPNPEPVFTPDAISYTECDPLSGPDIIAAIDAITDPALV